MPFQKVLVANRGEIARRVLRTCRRLGIRTVAIYSQADKDAPHVAEADEAVFVGPPAPKDSYLNVAAIVAAVRATGADAVHPGYGFLSEKADFARAVAAAGAVFVGPPPGVLEQLGDKVQARRAARAVGVAPVPGSEDVVAADSPLGLAEARQTAREAGYPVIVKAVGGGGGIGMQIVADEAGLERALQTCRDRGRAAFADPRVYIERYVKRPRHIEVQIFCDSKGGAYALGERECSVQRRHQKIVEETPSPAPFFEGPDGALRKQHLFDSAVRLVRSVGYVGAGTCEFVADEKGALYFLEVNARLQVEHPVTEMVTGLDLVALQLRVAAGESLPDLSLTPRRGHAIEARICAEDADKGFIPRPGRIDDLAWAGGQGEPYGPRLRVDAGVKAGSVITPYYDSMFAKISAWGETRALAIDGLSRALAATEVGPCTTNIPFLKRLLGTDEFRDGTYDTHFAESLQKRGTAT